jgi:membrane associated rhomboid family serine protease
MRSPRRYTSRSPLAWSSGQQPIALMLVSLLVLWAGGQVALWLWEVNSGLKPHLPTPLWEIFRLDNQFTAEHHYWKLFTHALLHNDVAHFTINLAILGFAGREIEPIIGRRQFLALSLTSWLFGGAVSWLIHIWNGPASAEVAGFSATAAAVLAAYSTIMPELEQRLNVFYVIPLRFRAKFYSLGVVSLAAICLFTETLTVVGPAGILVGSVMGWAWAKQMGFGNPLWIQRMIFDRRQRETRLERLNAEDFVALEVDPILDKISREGLQSITRAEWRILEQGSDKLGGTTRSTTCDKKQVSG